MADKRRKGEQGRKRIGLESRGWLPRPEKEKCISMRMPSSIAAFSMKSAMQSRSHARRPAMAARKRGLLPLLWRMERLG